MFTLIGRTFIAYEDKHLGLSTVALLTQSQGNTNEDEWFSLLTNLIESNLKVHETDIISLRYKEIVARIAADGYCVMKL